MGSRLGRYVLLKHLASGGMADLLLARSDGIEGFERHVVIKRIRPELGQDQRFIKMFLDEARVAATLHHQNILQVYDIGEDDGEYFIAMEYVHGEDTRKLLASASRQRTHVPVRYAVAIVSAAAAGLHHAHEQRGSDGRPLNIVHRDVSPSNILIGYDGAIKLLDFGIATASTLQETRSGSLKGKLSYMAPEQCKGIPIDRRTDVYALGAVLYELATTTRMIKGDTDYLVMEQIVNGRIAPPQSRRADLPAALVEIIMRALANDRENRFATAEEFRFALDSFAANTGLTAPSSAIQSYMQKQFGHRPEPWIDLDGEAELELTDLVRTAVDPGLDNAWGEVPRVDSSDLRLSGVRQLPARRAKTQSYGAARPRTNTRQPLGAPETPAAPPEVPLSTASHKNWNGTQAPRRSWWSGARVALIAIAAIAGIAVWLVTSRLRVEPPATAALSAVSPPAASPPQTTPPPLPAAASPVASPPAAEATADATPAPSDPPDSATGLKVDTPSHGSEPKGRSRGAVPGRTATARVQDKLQEPPHAKPDRPTRAAPATEPSPRLGDGAAFDGEHRAPVAPPPTQDTSTAPVPVAPPPQPPRPTPPPPVAAPAPQVVSPTTLEAYRIAGDRTIAPDPVTMDAFTRSGEDKLVSTYKVCITAEGAIDAVTQMKSSGYPAYDEKIRTAIRKEWRYKAYLVDGKPQPVCTGIRFIYSQK